MARASLATLLSLDEWAEIMGISPWEFNQIGQGFSNDKQRGCQQVWYQYAWQRDFIAREEIAVAISHAESMLSRVLRWWPAPKFFTNEEHPIPRPYNSDWFGGGGTPRCEWKTVELDWGYLRGAGVLNRSQISASVNVTPSDEDNDGIKELFTATVAAPAGVTDPCEVGVYFKAADRNNVALDEQWRIRPVNVTISAGTITITGHRSLLVLPDLTTVTEPESLDVSVDGNYATAVEVWRVFRDTTATSATPYQGVAQWDVPPVDCEGTAPCGFQVKEICIGYKHLRKSIVYASYGVPSTWPYPHEADRVSVNYQAGYPLHGCRMDRELARTVAYLATALLPSEQCGCERSKRIVAYWRKRVNEGANRDEQRPIVMEEALLNPFGDVRQGMIEAWHRIQPLIEGESVAL